MKEGEELTMDHANKLKYTEMVIKETTRILPLLPNVIRKCTKDWKMPGTDFVVKKGMRVACSSIGCHMDPKYSVVRI